MIQVIQQGWNCTSHYLMQHISTASLVKKCSCVILYDLRNLLLNFRELKNSWMLEPDPLKGQVTCLETFDLTCDGNQELILGRDDGLIEVYKLGQEEEDIHLIYSYVSFFICQLNTKSYGSKAKILLRNFIKLSKIRTVTEKHFSILANESF